MTATQVPTARVTTGLAGLADVRGWQEQLHRHLHRHPELSSQERRTVHRVAERLPEHRHTALVVAALSSLQPHRRRTRSRQDTPDGRRGTEW